MDTIVIITFILNKCIDVNEHTGHYIIEQIFMMNNGFYKKLNKSNI